MSTHNKKKNAALMYGSLIRFIAEATAAGDQRRVRMGAGAARLEFAPDTLLGHELRLHEAISARIGCSREVAERIVEDVLGSARSVDPRHLSESLSAAYVNMRGFMGEGFLDRYPAIDAEVATVAQSLFDSVRKGSLVEEAADRARMREALVRNLMSSEPAPEPAPDPDRNMLALKLATEGFNREYSDKLSPVQMEVLDAYVVGVSKGDYTRYSRVAQGRLSEALGRLGEYRDREKADPVLSERIERVITFGAGIDTRNPASLADVLDIQSVMAEVLK